MPVADFDLACLRRAIALSHSARARGNQPYGAILAAADGRVLATAENTQVVDRDCTAHAETNLVRGLRDRFDDATLRAATLYASGEPCAMCAGAIYWSGIGRVVYALSQASMGELAGAGADDLRLSCRDVIAHGTRTIEIVGPMLQDEARLAFGER